MLADARFGSILLKKSTTPDRYESPEPLCRIELAPSAAELLAAVTGVLALALFAAIGDQHHDRCQSRFPPFASSD
jgi:hypothetical protein